MLIPSPARDERTFYFPSLLKTAHTSLVAVAVALLATSCGGGDPAEPVAESVATTKTISNASPPPSPTTVQISMSQGSDAIAFFDSFDPTGCVDTNVFVAWIYGATKTVANGGPARTAAMDLNVSVNQYDFCRQVVLLSAFGDNPTFTFQIAPDLSSSRVTGMVTLTDFVSATDFDVQVDVTWAGNGPMSGTTITQHTSSFPGGVFNSRVNGFSRAAVASGTVASNTTNFTPAASTFAEMDRGSSGVIDITPVASSTTASTTP
ncbi:hypothetical protein [Cupriavidus sp. TMH.W2]|uniref:hypothetical protein n=1 Tax=Cupriavidus sp. TMH.W2 TaxID=3434465 RepID=UPI003D775ED4